MSRRLIPSTLGCWLGCWALLGSGCSAPGPALPSPEEEAWRDVRLVVLVAVDQLRPDRLSEAMPGGLGRLVRDGRAFVDAAFEHAFTETCPGYAVMLTGRHPARIGIPTNNFVDPETLERRYCVEDRAADAAVIGLRSPEPQSPADGRSPRAMKSSALGDWMKARRPETKVYSVSGKDRAAITLGGLRADAAYWLARGPSPSWVTSRYYRDALPAWVRAWDSQAILGGLPPDWMYLPEIARSAAGGARPDDYPYESPLLSRTQPHPLLRDPSPGEPQAAAKLPSLARHPADRLYATPFADRVTLAFAKSLVEIERLGRGGGPDLLALGLSATDLVGHFYGPESWESRDALARLDQMLGDFFDFLEREVGKDRFVVVLTADHGVLPIPEWLQEQGRSRCPVPGGRVAIEPLVAALEKRLDEAFPQAAARTDSSWFRALGGRLTLDRRRTRGDDALETRVMAVATTFLESQPGIERVWSSEEVLGGEGPEPMATWYRNAWVPGITGDLALQVAEDCLLGDLGLATSHGSPYGYDRKVPLVFMGPDIEAGKVFDQPASPVDIAPTLAHYLELSAPVGLDGQVLKLKER